MKTAVPSVAKVLLTPIFSNLNNFGTERDTTNEHKMNSVDICSVVDICRCLKHEREQYFSQ